MTIGPATPVFFYVNPYETLHCLINASRACVIFIFYFFNRNEGGSRRPRSAPCSPSSARAEPDRAPPLAPTKTPREPRPCVPTGRDSPQSSKRTSGLASPGVGRSELRQRSRSKRARPHDPSGVRPVPPARPASATLVRSAATSRARARCWPPLPRARRHANGPDTALKVRVLPPSATLCAFLGPG